MVKSVKWPILAATLFTALCVIVINYYFLTPSSISDARWYVDIAKGNITDVIQPFSGRVLHPLTVGFISSLSGLSVDFSFFTLNVFLILGFVFVLSFFFSEISFVNPASTFLIIFSPFLLELFHSFYLPELFYGFFLILFFHFLRKNNFIASLLLLFIAFLIRPTEALILGVILVVISFYKSEKKFTKVVFIVTLIGFLLSSQINALGQPNIHNISNFKFLVLKPAYNFVRSYLGIDWLTNTMLQYCEPRISLSVPAWLKMGNIKWVGICDFNIGRPLTTLLHIFTSFGVIPSALFLVLRRHWRQTFSDSPLWLLVALTYGSVMFFFGSLVSYGGLRTLGYGWPAFWLAAPVLFDKYLGKLTVRPNSPSILSASNGLTLAARRNIVNWFLATHIILLWVPYLLI